VRPGAPRQRGAVGVVVALSLIVLIGFLAVVLDLGRLLVMKTELQNASDACALAAAYELDGNASALTRAENAGITVGASNAVVFQSTPVAVSAADIKFSTTLSGAGGSNAVYQTQAGGAPANSKYAMCSLTRAGVPMTLTTLLGSGPKTVAAQAVATMAPSQSACSIPIGVCTKGAAPSYGLSPGQWVSGRFDAGGGLTGSYNWIDFTPPGGGQNELAGLLTGSGTCATSTGTPVGEAGVMGNAAARAWNSRFGLYQGGGGNPNLGSATPDFSGYAYTSTSWPAQANALPDFMNVRRAAHSAYQGNAASGLSISNAYNSATPAQLATSGASRRLTVAPLVDCAGWASSQTVPIVSYACVLMLHPIGSPGDVVNMEYVGLANALGSPCSTNGLAGGSFGPLVPVLVQ
jgi:Flp pilus assembly protein TadG